MFFDIYFSIFLCVWYIPSWALKDCKLSIENHLQFANNECIKTNTFPDILIEVYVIPIYKKSDRHTLKTIDQFWLLQRQQNFSKTSPGTIFATSRCEKNN